MSKRIFSLMLALLMVTSFSATAFAAKYTDSVNVTANLQVAPTGTAISAETGSEASVVKSASQPFPAFDFKCTLNMEAVRAKFNEYFTNWQSILSYAGPSNRVDELNLEMQAMKITGSFTAEIIYPNTVTIPEEFLKNNQMVGFDDNAKRIFGNDIRTVTDSGTNKKLTIAFSIVGTEATGRPGYVVANDLFTNIDTYLADFTLLLGNVGTADYGTYEVQGKLTGTTAATGDTTTLTITYQTNPEYAEAVATVTEKDGHLPPLTPPSELVTKTYEVNFYVDGAKTEYAPVVKEAGATVSLSDLPIPYQDGYSFDGWYFDKAMTEKVTESFTLSKNISLYAAFKAAATSEKLNDIDHFAYVIGYPDGTVRPNALITREEVATIFFRLLTEEAREELYSKNNPYSDVQNERWSNTAISTLDNGDILHGYEDGTFRPERPVTRAEFVAIASRLDDMTANTTHSFTDISGHWAEAYIANAVAKGWITGYEDGTFCPEQNITRAEAMTIVNRMLKRFLMEDGHHSDAMIWPDNPEDAWFHLAVIEATNGHHYERDENEVHETWPALRENPDWAALEQ